jgi:hypothetical protein
VRRSAALIAAAFALALAVALWLFLAGTSVEVGAADSASRDEVASPEDVGRVTAERGAEAGGRAATQASEPAPLVDAPPKAIDPALRSIAVVRAGDFAPLAGAEVLWWPRAALPEQETALELWLAASGGDADLPAGFSRAISDERGLALLPDAEHGIEVLARSEGWLGVARFLQGDTPPMRVVVHPDRPVRVRVVDRERSPVEGVHVAVVADKDYFGYSRVRALTDAQGVAVLPHALYGLHEQSELLDRATVVVEELLEEVVWRDFDAQSPPPEPIELVIPRGGECEVRVVDSEGRPATGPYRVYLMVDDNDEPVDVDEIRPWWGNGLSRFHVTSGTALFREVRLGQRLIASVEPSSGLGFFNASAVGPRRLGERVTIEVRATGLELLTARVLRTDGQPLGNTALKVRAVLGESSDDAADFYELDWRPVTDAEGRLRIEFDADDLLDEDEDMFVEFVQIDPRQVDVARVRTQLPRVLPRGSADLGDLRLSELPVFVAGVTLDSARRPVGGVEVTAQAHQRDDYGELTLQPVPGVRALSDAQGRFVLRAPASLREAQLTAQKSELSSEPRDASVGAKDVELVLLPAGEIAGKVELHRTIQPSRLYMRAHLENTESEDESEHWIPLGADGSFYFRSLKPGRYTVAACSRDRDSPLETVEGVEVRRGEVTRDPRLDPLSLDASLRGVELSIVDLAGQPILDGISVVSRRGGADDSDWGWVEARAGVALILVGAQPPAVTVLGDEYITEHLPLVTESRTVVMRRAPKVTYRLIDAVDLPQDMRLGVRAEHEAGDKAGFSWNFEQPWFDADGRASCRVRHLGKYKLRFTLTLVGDRWESREIPTDPPFEFQVRELPAEQVVEVRCPSEALQATIEALRRP